MRQPDQHPFTLRFLDPSTERDFRREYAWKSLVQARYALLLGTLMYAAFGVLDRVVVPEQVATMWMIRGIVCTLGLTLFAASFTAVFLRVMQELLALILLVAGGGLVLMLALKDEPGQAYFNGPVLVILPTYVLARLRFVYATTVGWLIVVGFTSVAIARGTAPGVLLGAVLFQGCANLIGMYAGYMLEDYARRDFWQARSLDARRRENRRLLELRTRFFSNVSHEFRTPLTLILGPLDDLLRRADLDGDVRETLARTHRNARRLLDLIDELLQLARLESGALPLAPQPARLGTFVRGVAGAFDSAAEDIGVDLRVDVDDDLVVSFDAEQLDKVFINLIGNALKFSPVGGTIRVRVTAEAPAAGQRPGWALVSVRDTGPGIPAADLPHVFERFQQSSPPLRSGQMGTGIGLALVREIVELHGGQVDVRSEEGFGSEFIVRLPADPGATLPTATPAVLPQHARTPSFLAPSAEPSPTTHDPEATDEDAETILIVEDHDDMRAYVRSCLDGYRILEAADGAAGLALAREEVPDLILSDVMMPRMDGFDLVRALRADPATDHVPVVLLTARAAVESRLEGLATGADDYLPKPFDRRELRLRIHNLLEARRKLRARYDRTRLVTVAPIEVESADDAFVAQARAVVDEHMTNPHFDVDAFAEAMAMSRRQLQRKVRALTGETPNAFIRLARLARAAQLLEGGHGSVADVAFATGFSSASYFTRCFQDTFGTPPSDYTGSAEKPPHREEQRS